MPTTALKSAILRSLRDFGQAVTRKMAQSERGQPEEQLRAPFETFLRDTSGLLGTPAECVGEPSLPDSLGRPDYADASLNRLYSPEQMCLHLYLANGIMVQKMCVTDKRCAY